MTNPSDVLGVNSNPSEEEISSAYKKQVKLYHPDKFNPKNIDANINGVDPNKLFIDIKRANNALTGDISNLSFNYDWENGEPVISEKNKGPDTYGREVFNENKNGQDIDYNSSQNSHSENNEAEKNRDGKKENESDGPWDPDAKDDVDLGNTVGANINDRSKKRDSTQSDSTVGGTTPSASFSRSITVLIGFFPSFLLMVIPILGPTLGGGIAGYLRGQNSKEGSIVGVLTNIIAVTPFILFWLFIVSGSILEITVISIYVSICGAFGGAIGARHWKRGESKKSTGTAIASVVHILGLLTWVFGPLIMYLILNEGSGKRNAANALNWQIMLFIYYFISFFLTFLFIGFALIPLLLLLNLLFCITATVKALQGERWSYPITYNFV